MRSNLLSLQQTAKLQDLTQNRLATGLKVNSAIDNPSSYYTAQSLNNRAEDLNILLDAMSQGIQTLKAVNESIEAGTKFLEQAKSVANSAMETAQPVVAKVSTEEELLVAVNSGKKGLIVLTSDITMSTNQNIVLNDGQSLVGTRYFDKNAAQIKLTLSTDKIQHGITVSGKSIISDLNITYNVAENTTQASYAKTAAIYAEKGAVLKLNNADITLDTSKNNVSFMETMALLSSSSEIEFSGINNMLTTGSYSFGIMLADSNVSMGINARLNITAEGQVGYGLYLFGTDFTAVKNNLININIGGEGRGISFGNGDKSNVNLGSATQLNIIATANYGSGIYANDISQNSAVNVSDNAVLNIKTSGNSGLGVFGANLNIQNNAVANIKTTGDYAYGFFRGTVIVENNSRLNFLGTGKDGTAFNYSHLHITSPNAGVYLLTEKFVGFGNQNNLSAVSGATMMTNDGVYQANTSYSGILHQTDNLGSDFIKISEKDPDKIPQIDDEIKKEPISIKENATNIATAEQFNQILTQYDMLINDSWYKGVNLLKSQDLKVVFNESRTSDLDIKGVDATTKGLGLKTADWSSADGVQNSLDQIDSAINQLRLYASEFGNYYQIVTTRENFTNSLINVLTEGADALTLADMNQESANMLALQTRQQLAINSLSLASQASQSVLKLF